MKGDEIKEMSMRERLIQAGITDLNKNGTKNFSVRRIAAICGISCAAPYKHFRDKQDFLLAIIRYIDHLWDGRQQKVLETVQGDTRKRIVAVSVEYVRFLVENPHFRSVIMLQDSDLDEDYVEIRRRLNQKSKDLVGEYCASVGMTMQVQNFKVFVVRSLIYGASLMMDNESMEYNEENLEMVASAIDREFDL
ncbi:TetR/AcrR family transcriptional regulator [Parasporobacterium paucivorans]|uniref:Transcriptional regulator, TetR family n=1 Tax=Parasporobacterium paucivorans DSM 15970 TaxID=1122934 RepID=A0A1M6KD44_9FIRM|nr:TetR/AcrR family transcriptional regulator [Parasporobacterium paucivorans]SHJ56865.1 transcriptional regulator, TetR family [Parasporobacterium paucivorans DSM 15970]